MNICNAHSIENDADLLSTGAPSCIDRSIVLYPFRNKRGIWKRHAGRSNFN